MTTIGPNVLRHKNGVLQFIMPNGKSELVFQGFLINGNMARAIDNLAMEPGKRRNLYTCRVECNNNQVLLLHQQITDPFHVLYKWEEPGYMPWEINDNYTKRRL